MTYGRYATESVPSLLDPSRYLSIGKLGTARDSLNRPVVQTREDTYCCHRCLRIYPIHELDAFILHSADCTRSFTPNGLSVIPIGSLKKVPDKPRMGIMIQFDKLIRAERGLEMELPPRRDKLPWRLHGVMITFARSNSLLGMLVTKYVLMPEDPNAGLFYFGEYTHNLVLHEFGVVLHARRSGIGNILFNAMLKYHDIKASDIYYPYPSKSFVYFIKKWYKLKQLKLYC